MEGVEAASGASVQTDDEASSKVSARVSLEEILDETHAGAAERETGAQKETGTIGVRTARLVRVTGREATVTLRGQRTPVEVAIAEEVDPEILADALANGERVLLEYVPGEAPQVVGVLQTQRPREIHLRAATIHIEGEQEVILRSGRGAVRIRQDGDIEMEGSRISAVSQGLFRLVGRLLRLN
jgi:hypothetical protein